MGTALTVLIWLLVFVVSAVILFYVGVFALMIFAAIKSKPDEDITVKMARERRKEEHERVYSKNKEND